MKPLTILCWKWDYGVHPKKKIMFTHNHVNVLYSMLKRNLHLPFELVCITDDSRGIHKDISIIPIWKEYAYMGGCFRRLKVFSSEAAVFLDCKRFVSIDLDCVIVDDITSLFIRKEDFIIWGETWRNFVYCGALWMMDCGCRTEVWDTFNPKNYPINKKGTYSGGTDQKHINTVLYPKEVMWDKKDGIHNFVTDIAIYDIPKIFRHRERKICGGDGLIPKEAKIIFFNGKFDPCQADTQIKYPWIMEYWR